MASMFQKAASAFSGVPEADQVQRQDEEGESLTTILETEKQRSALTILVADLTEVMRKQLLDVFDARETGKQEDLFATLKDEQGNPIDLDKVSDDERRRQVQRLAEKQKKDFAAREKEVTEAKMVELKLAALSYFDGWRDTVIQRVGEVVNSKRTAKAQGEHAAPKTDHSHGVDKVRGEKLSQHDRKEDQELQQLYPRIQNGLVDLDQEKRALILHSILLLLLSLEHYQAYSRTLLLRLTISLRLPVSLLAQEESKVARGLLQAAETMDADKETKAKAEAGTAARKWKVGLAGVGGALLVGVTGGLAAPFLAAGIGTVMGGLGLGATAAAGYLGTLAGSSVLVGGLFGAYGGRMTSQAMEQYSGEVEDFAFEPVRANNGSHKIEKENRRLRVAIGVSGWLRSRDDVIRPWKVIGEDLEAFALRFELEKLINLGNALSAMVSSAIWSYAQSEVIRRTVFGALSAGLWPLALLKAGRVLDNPWMVANNRSQKAGEVLAEALINKAQGERPVTLVGYSLGARVIYICLQELAARKAFGLVEDVIFMGAPTPSNSDGWRKIRTVVSGRVVNAYSTQDYILGYLYRSSNIQFGVAGLQPVVNVKGIENVDITDLVQGHTLYRVATGPILKRIGFADLDMEALHREEVEKRKQEEEEQESQHQSAAASDKDAQGDDASKLTDQDYERLAKDVEQKNQQSHLERMTEQMKLTGERTSDDKDKTQNTTEVK